MGDFFLVLIIGRLKVLVPDLNIGRLKVRVKQRWVPFEVPVMGYLQAKFFWLHELMRIAIFFLTNFFLVIRIATEF